MAWLAGVVVDFGGEAGASGRGELMIRWNRARRDHGVGVPVWRAVVLVCILVHVGCSEPPPSPTPPPQAAVPIRKPFALTIASELTVAPASSGTASVRVDRGGHPGDVILSFGQLPDGVTATADPIPGDAREGTIVVTVDERLGDAEQIVAIPVTASVDGVTAQQNLTCRVAKLEMPTFTQDGDAIVQPGGTTTVSLRVAWPTAAKKRIELAPRVAGDATAAPAGPTPPDLTASPVTIEDEEIVSLEVSAAGDAKDGTRSIPLAGRYMGRDLPVAVSVQVLARPYRVAGAEVVWVAPGEKRTVPLEITRDAYQGAIEISADGLPDGVSCVPGTLAEGSDGATIEVQATPDAEPQLRSARIVAVGGHFTVTAPFVLRVHEPGSDGTLPEAVFGSRESKRLMRKGSIGGRLTSESKAALADLYGGTAESTAAVHRGLAWLARTQQADGSWTLKGAAAPPSGEPPDDEPQTNPTAATAFGVLPFLGEGISHQRAPADPVEFAGYKSVVEKGLVYLASNQKRAKGSSDGFFGGSMYAHCLATIAFCEAYGLSRDERTKVNAKQGIKYLLAAQDPEGGGWRYGPKQKGDLSVTGWVVIALRSAQLAGLSVPMKQLRKAEEYIESVAAGPESAPESLYRYEAAKPATAPMTATGLLSRLYLGWSREEPDLDAGRDYLMEHMPPEYGESLGPLYYYYYATQVLHHLEGEEFDAWNQRMREHLLRLQRTSGELEGSWDPRGCDRGKEGGRMYSTALSLLTLQVYYRHLPMYREVNPSSASVATAEDEAEESAAASASPE